ncbi:hypothetical protein DOK67_0000160 [Enterococcus sp. DIV0212c]|uniref:hypothetical protein n=1 Tax=Enterococcus sp. DIV0212c TaxID=2230867 RepID=UPI001A9C06DE|nr:hypothetical protein [Enterococcus sp. DIV0212c]MBO1354010.1 hypothetical protein [Enterococcus sp. DIV0212c]
MTEKTRLLEFAISEIDRVLLGNKSPDVNEVYLNNAKRYIRESMTDHQSVFTVGEYYFAEYEDTQRIYRIEKYNVSDGRSIAIKAYAAEKGELITFNWGIDQMIDDKPATAEQIKEFKLAEAIEKSGLTPEQHKQMLSDGKMNIGVWLALQTTAEELQEVEKP